MADESSRGGTGSQLPESEGLVPRSGQGVGTIRGDDLKVTVSQLFLRLEFQHPHPRPHLTLLSA